MELPVRGWAEMSPEGYFEKRQDRGRAAAPEGLQDPDAFYARAPDYSMSRAEIGAGNYCLVSPGVKLEAGQRVWLKNRQGQEVLRWLLDVGDTGYKLRGWRGPLGGPGSPQAPQDDWWARDDVVATGIVLAVYRVEPAATGPLHLAAKPDATVVLQEGPPTSVNAAQFRDLEGHAQGLVRALVAAGGDPIPPELRERWQVSTLVAIPFAADIHFATGSGEPVWNDTVEMAVSVQRSSLAAWARPDRLWCARVAGDSMAPAIRDGDLVVLDPSRREPLEDQVFGVRTEEGFVAKRLHCIDGCWYLVSDNPNHEPQPIAEEDRILGQVAWTGPPVA